MITLLTILVGIVFVVLYFVMLGVGSCPRCGIELGVDIGVGLSHRVGTERCRGCGWRRGERP
jgi:hypothetical protein